MSDSSISPMKETITERKMEAETTPTTQSMASSTKLAEKSTPEVATKPQVEVRDEDTKNLATAYATMLKTGEFMKSLTAQCVAYHSMGHAETGEAMRIFMPTVGAVTKSEPEEEALPSEDMAEDWGESLLQLELVKERVLSDEERAVLRAFACGMHPATRESSEKAARAINALCPPLDQDNTEAERWLWMSWEVMLTIVQIPDVATDVFDRLLSTLEALQHCARGNVKIYGKNERLWKDMPLLADAVDTYIEDPTTGIVEFTDKADKIWQNMTAFAARGLGASVLGPYDRAMLALISALEEEPSRTQGILDCRVKAACTWITHASKPLFRWALENAGRTDVSPDDTAVCMDGGPLHHGPPIMCLQRWGFWIDRLEELGKDGSGAGEEARKVALETARTMRQVEAQLGHTL